MQLKKAYYDRKPVEKPRKKKLGDSKNPHESDSTEEGHDTQLKKEMATRKADLKKINCLLTASFKRRRKWIEGLSGKGTVHKILKEYPGFRNYQQVISLQAFATLETRRGLRVVDQSCCTN